jgi:hypothetical protein
MLDAVARAAWDRGFTQCRQRELGVPALYHAFAVYAPLSNLQPALPLSRSLVQAVPMPLQAAGNSLPQVSQ